MSQSRTCSIVNPTAAGRAGPILLALAVGLLARSYFVRFLPYTVWLLLGGMVIGACYTEEGVLSDGLEKSVGNWVDLDPVVR
jgi:hypothetical protein